MKKPIIAVLAVAATFLAGCSQKKKEAEQKLEALTRQNVELKKITSLKGKKPLLKADLKSWRKKNRLLRKNCLKQREI